MTKKYVTKARVSNDLVEQLLHNRGIITKEEKDKFLNPDFERDLHDPFLLPDMEKAVDRILKAIEKNEKVGIWTDYDADGIPGGALLHDFFKLLGFNNFVNYIPDRHLEGYGLNIEGIDELASSGTKLLITVDCGIRDIDQIEYAKKLGLDVIVTDHHEPGEVVPDAFAIVNPKIKNSKYPEQILCGSGVVWKLIEGILIKRKQNNFKEGAHKWLLDMAGLATLSDMVPLLGENRAISHFGLTVLRKTRREGLRKLYSILKINPANLTEDDIGFLVSPRINAASRMGHPRDAFDLLVAETEVDAHTKAIHLDSINSERKVLVATIVKAAKKMLKQKWESEGEREVIVLGDPAWRPAVLGLAANSLAEEYGRPAFLWGRETGNGFKGSCRSDGEADLVAIMENSKAALAEFGGHKMSGGFSLEFEQIPELENVLIDSYKKVYTSSSNKTENIKTADAEINLSDVNMDTARSIQKLAPFGVGNEKPQFILSDILPQNISRFGKNKEHLSIDIVDVGKKVKAISFFTEPDKFGDSLKEGIKTNLVANLELSYWRGDRPDLRLRIVDIFK